MDDGRPDETQTLQAMLDAHRGGALTIPPGDHVISQKLRIRGHDTWIAGPARIIQVNPAAPILEIENASGVMVRDLLLTRAGEERERGAEGLVALRCDNLVLDNVQVRENRAQAAAISLRECRGAQVRHCTVLNYMTIGVDDRTPNPDWGYAFACIDGTGVAAVQCQATLLQGNRIIEQRLVPTPELQKRHNLGVFVKKNPQKGKFLSQETWDSQYVNNWHQGSAIVINTGESSDMTQILGNTIENAAQGVDIHSDHVIMAHNIIHNAFAGMKAMHGSQHVMIIGNQFIKNDLWAIGLMPGAASHGAEPARDGKAARGQNVDGGSIVANNIISQFGRGSADWMWAGYSRSPLKFDRGQKPENPPLTDVLVQGNIVHDSERERAAEAGQAAVAPRYKYAVNVAGGPDGPKHIRFSNNLFDPGTDGVSNIELKP